MQILKHHDERNMGDSELWSLICCSTKSFKLHGFRPWANDWFQNNSLNFNNIFPEETMSISNRFIFYELLGLIEHIWIEFCIILSFQMIERSILSKK